jgi:hypothetical protein
VRVLEPRTVAASRKNAGTRLGHLAHWIASRLTLRWEYV